MLSSDKIQLLVWKFFQKFFQQDNISSSDRLEKFGLVDIPSRVHLAQDLIQHFQYHGERLLLRREDLQNARTVEDVVNLVERRYGEENRPFEHRQRPSFRIQPKFETSFSGALDEAPTQKPETASVRIWFATDRSPTGDSAANTFFGSERHDLTYGTAEVTIPAERHRLGQLEAPSIWRLQFREDPKRHIILKSITPQAKGLFFDDLKAAIGAARDKVAFIFIHGFYVSFRDAARRTAQIAWDLNFTGAPILYSWPSAAKVDAYPVDETNVQWTVPHLENFLTDVVRHTGATKIFLIAHSLGNQLLVNTLQRLAGVSPLFSEILLTAPDIDGETLADLVDKIRPTAKRMTLYASNRDRALRLSRKFNGYWRAGDSAEHVFIAPGIETIDASAVDTSFLGHSYYGGARSVLSDMFYLFQGAAVSARHGITISPTGKYWIFQP